MRGGSTRRSGHEEEQHEEAMQRALQEVVGAGRRPGDQRQHEEVMQRALQEVVGPVGVESRRARRDGRLAADALLRVGLAHRAFSVSALTGRMPRSSDEVPYTTSAPAETNDAGLPVRQGKEQGNSGVSSVHEVPGDISEDSLFNELVEEAPSEDSLFNELTKCSEEKAVKSMKSAVSLVGGLFGTKGDQQTRPLGKATPMKSLLLDDVPLSLRKPRLEDPKDDSGYQADSEDEDEEVSPFFSDTEGDTFWLDDAWDDDDYGKW